MTELEQLRKEVNELRERVRLLEHKQIGYGERYLPNPPSRFFPTVTPNTFPYHHDIWCSTTTTKDE